MGCDASMLLVGRAEIEFPELKIYPETRFIPISEKEIAVMRRSIYLTTQNGVNG